ncbi:hypothetical protein ALGA_0575 [Labilibaculum antarcticum]|uniref:DUF3570 domain-containing protein n=2 Tax=Labilibaculum antarcticum TaxID=1717717 RepID=A0A1Y1CF29_9BACT|nr:hypothetical protein ALGA_0575 [Labilibaculum antarcticum]
MQLKTILSLLLLLSVTFAVNAQTDKNSIDDKQEDSRKKVKLSEDYQETEVNFLLNYYEQDGDHSPVTGGQGTEELTNVAPSFVVHIPVDSLSSLDLNFGIDIYSSASTDNIDYFDTHKSSASGMDARAHINAYYSHKLLKSGNDYSVLAGFSQEYDVSSYHAGGSYTLNSKDQNRSLTIDGLYMNDSWKLLYPTELRGSSDANLKDDVRTTLKFGLSYSQVINKRSQALFSMEVVSQSGLLSTPFHRVFFDDAFAFANDKNELATRSHIEQLDDSRIKIPISMRWNYYISDFIRLKTFYRYYSDSWGISAHTASVELPMMVSPSFIISPFARYHTQTAADDFYEFGQASSTAEFYTSDYDLSEFDSFKVGVGFQYSPVTGISNFKSPLRKGKTAQLKSIGLRTAYYDRSDGLNAWLVSLDFAFTF